MDKQEYKAINRIIRMLRNSIGVVETGQFLHKHGSFDIRNTNSIYLRNRQKDKLNQPLKKRNIFKNLQGSMSFEIKKALLETRRIK